MEELIKLFEFGKDKCWITGRLPDKLGDVPCIRLTREDFEVIIKALKQYKGD